MGLPPCTIVGRHSDQMDQYVLSDSTDDVRTICFCQPAVSQLFAFLLFSREATGTVRATGGMGSTSRAGKKFENSYEILSSKNPHLRERQLMTVLT